MINTEKCRELPDHYIVHLTLTLYVNYTGGKKQIEWEDLKNIHCF